MPPFEGPINPDPPLSALGRDALGDWMGYDDPYNTLKNLEDGVRPGASTWFRAGRGWASFPGSYEGSSAASMSAYMVATYTKKSGPSTATGRSYCRPESSVPVHMRRPHGRMGG